MGFISVCLHLLQHPPLFLFHLEKTSHAPVQHLQLLLVRMSRHFCENSTPWLYLRRIFDSFVLGKRSAIRLGQVKLEGKMRMQPIVLYLIVGLCAKLLFFLARFCMLLEGRCL